MLQAPSGDFTVSDVFTLNNFGEIDLASGTTPLRQPTDVARPRSAAAQAVADDNAARAVTLDDGSSTNYLSAASSSQPLPWITQDTPVRVGAVAHFTKPVVLDYRNDLWKFQPTSQLTPANAATVQPATFPNTRTAAPEHVDGDLKIASFNVLNFFNETGQAYAAEGHTCTSFKDRTGEPVTVTTAGPTARAAPGTTRTGSASWTRRSGRSTPSVPTCCRWRRSRTPPSTTGRRTATSPWPRWSPR